MLNVEMALHRFICALRNEAKRSLRDEASNARQLEIVIATVKFMEANCAEQ